MARFEISEAITGRNEGGYANNTADKGGETYAGVARKYWPKWSGWEYIDLIKEQQGTNPATINKYAKSISALQQAVSNFYRVNFWDVNRLSLFDDQQIANTVYDFGVNSGTLRAAKMLQEVLGVVVDGKIGSKTIAAVNGGNPKAIHTAYNCKREAFYKSIAVGTQKQFLKSWLSRLKPYI